MDPILIQIAATFTAEPLKEPLGYLFKELGFPSEVEFSPFNQVFQELLSPQSAFVSNQRGANVILLRWEDLVDSSNLLTGQAFTLLQRNATDLIQALSDQCKRFRVPTLLVICPPSGAALASAQVSECVNSLDELVRKSLSGAVGLMLVDNESIRGGLSVEAYDDPRSSRIASIPYTGKFFCQLSKCIARKVHRIVTPPQKVIVLDCDNTLWKGVVGEDGIQGIEMDPPRLWLQRFMQSQGESGMLLCICSKNNEADVWEVFENRKDMVLRRENIVSWRINWQPKSENIRSLARELQLGLDSFIFVDDDATVCAEVGMNCPEVVTIRVPESANEIVPTFSEHWIFDHVSVTAEDRQRSEMYRQNAERHRVLESAGSIDDFLAKLELRCEVTRCNESTIERVAQLTQRTNQFNASGTRRTAPDLQEFLAHPGRECWVVSVQDRFGDYGLVGALVLLAGPSALKIDSFLLSCRALGRGVEHRMLAFAGRRALELSLDKLEIPVFTTQKNKPARDFFESSCKVYSNPTEGGVIYCPPAQFASEIRVQNLDAASASNAESPARESTSDLLARRKQWISGLLLIATELRGLDALESRIASLGTGQRTIESEVVAPGNDSEAKLLEIWKSVLKADVIGVTDDYFALGGDSVKAVRVFALIEEELGAVMPLATLFTAPTIRQLASRLSQGENRDNLHLVCIQEGSGTLPLYCMHAAGGNVLFYRDLAKHLGSNFRIVGLQAREVPELGRYPDSVEDMAERYLKEILQDASGPYFFCGSSFGGLLAYEMAQRVVAMGKPIAFVGLFDTYGPGYPQKVQANGSGRDASVGLLQRFGNLVHQVRSVEHGKRANFLTDRMQRFRQRIRRRWIWKKNEFESKYREAVGGELPKDLQRNHKAIQKALADYRPKPTRVPITLFRAATQPKDAAPDEFLGWKTLCKGGLKVLESPGIHGAMTVDPYAAELSRQLGPLLRDAGIQRTI